MKFPHHLVIAYKLDSLDVIRIVTNDIFSQPTVINLTVTVISSMMKLFLLITVLMVLAYGVIGM